MKKFFDCIAVCLLLCSCGSDKTSDEPNIPPTTEKIPVKMSARSSSSSFADGANVGLYVVNFENGSATAMKSTGNHIDNRLFTYSDGAWRSASAIYWKDNSTKADFYCYYPYNSSISDSRNYTFTVATDQSTSTNYAASDFMWGKTAGQAPTASDVSMLLNHYMSHVLINVKAGEGFTESDLTEKPMSISINNLKYKTKINLADASLSVQSETSNITPFKTSDCQYKAIVHPQEISGSNLITVNLDGIEYNLKKAIVFESNKQYTFTITLSKVSGGINVGIGSWEDDGLDYGGIVE